MGARWPPGFRWFQAAEPTPWHLGTGPKHPSPAPTRVRRRAVGSPRGVGARGRRVSGEQTCIAYRSSSQLAPPNVHKLGPSISATILISVLVGTLICQSLIHVQALPSPWRRRRSCRPRKSFGRWRRTKKLREMEAVTMGG